MKIYRILAAVLLMSLLVGCGPKAASSACGEVFLYGEIHGCEVIMEKELELWKDCYEDGCRHLFLEVPYYTAGLLNCWMLDENDKILEALYADWEGTQIHTKDVLAFYRKIKDTCPETIFHGTDVGHQWDTTGERYLNYLEHEGKKDSEEWKRTETIIGQGQKYYVEGQDSVYREQCMADNFTWEIDNLNGKNVMGIYGSVHISLSGTVDSEGKIPFMAGKLRERYGEAIHTEDLSWLAAYVGTKEVEIAGREYEADAFYQDLRGYFENYSGRYFFRLKNVGEEFDQWNRSGNVLPYGNYPMVVEEGQVFLVELIGTDGSVISGIYRADGTVWNGQPSTWEIVQR